MKDYWKQPTAEHLLSLNQNDRAILRRKTLKELPKRNGCAVSYNPALASVIRCNQASCFLSTVSACNSTLMRLASCLGKDKAPIAEALTAMFESFKDTNECSSKANGSRNKKR